jgi:predicted nucleic acid-binding protein
VTEEALYLDSSAIVKLVLPEPETAALVSRLRHDPEVISSALARAEVLRALKRIKATPATRRQAERVLARVALIRVDDWVLDHAVSMDPPELRPLDAVHLATALGIGERLEALITYDSRLGDAAARAGLSVLVPV